MSETIQEMQKNVDLLSVLLWQYNFDEDDSVQSLLRQKSAWYDAQGQAFWDSWYHDVFDIRTANEFGLSVWAIVLGVPLSVDKFPNVKLTVEQKRLVIRLRFYQLITRATIPMVNAEMLDIFGEFGKAYALDPNDMSAILYVFRFMPDDDIKFILQNYDLLPRPATVGIKFRVLTGEYFGFGTHNANFNNGAFYRGDHL